MYFDSTSFVSQAFIFKIKDEIGETSCRRRTKMCY